MPPDPDLYNVKYISLLDLSGQSFLNLTTDPATRACAARSLQKGGHPPLEVEATMNPAFTRGIVGAEFKRWLLVAIGRVGEAKLRSILTVEAS